MLVNELLAMFVDENFQEIKIYDLLKEKEIYNGRAVDMPSEYGFLEISTIDNIGQYFGKDLVVNVEMEDYLYD